MSDWDLAISMNQDAVNRIIEGVFGKPGPRAELFKGSRTQDVLGATMTVSWDVQTAPRAVFEAPSAEQWKHAITADGNPLSSTEHAFSIEFRKVDVSYDGPPPASGTTNFDVICTVEVVESELAFLPVGVSVDLSSANPIDQFIYRSILIPRVLTAAAEMLSTQQIPDVDFQGVRFGGPTLAIGSGRAVAVANLEGKAVPKAPNPAETPNEEFCVRLSADSVKKIADTEVASFAGHSTTTKGKSSSGGFSAEYSGQVTLQSLSVEVDASNLTSFPAKARLSAKGEAGVNFLGGIVGGVVDGANAVADVATDAVDAVGDAARSVGKAISSY